MCVKIELIYSILDSRYGLQNIAGPSHTFTGVLYSVGKIYESLTVTHACRCRHYIILGMPACIGDR